MDQILETRITDALICGIKYHMVQKELLVKDATLTAKNAIDICRTHDISEQHMKWFHNLGNGNHGNIDARGDGSSNIDAMCESENAGIVEECICLFCLTLLLNNLLQWDLKCWYSMLARMPSTMSGSQSMKLQT